jgi:hypothetical protein
VAKVVAVDAALPFDPMAWEEDQPLLWLVTTGLFMAMALLVPAVVHAVRRSCLTIWMDFVLDRGARYPDGGPPGKPSEPSGRDDDRSSRDHEDPFYRAFPGSAWKSR